MANDQVDIDSVAADWVVRTQSDSVTEDDITGLAAWLEAAPSNVDAYISAASLWQEIGGSGDVFIQPEAPAIVSPLQRSRVRVAPEPYLWAGGAIAAALGVLLLFIGTLPRPVLYETAKGERREIVLSDGTHLSMNTDTKLSANVTRGKRVLTLQRGEVALKVVHDAAHPFIVHTGAITLTDLGTEFNVARLDGIVQVTMRSGQVEMVPANGKISAVILRQGDQGTYLETSGARTVIKADPQKAFAWQTGHAIYTNQPLSVVIKDLNRYFAKPIVVDKSAENLKINTILTLDSESSVVKRLQEYLPLDAQTTDQAIRISRRSIGPGGNSL